MSRDIRCGTRERGVVTGWDLEWGWVRHGTPAGYLRHLRDNGGPVTCQACCDAHEADRIWMGGDVHPTPAPRPGRDHQPLQYQAALDGREPADALTATDRARLVTELHRRGWTDVEIATHTRMTTFTTAEIRGRLGLAANAAVQRWHAELVPGEAA